MARVATAAIARAGSSDAPRISARPSAGTTVFHTTVDTVRGSVARADRVMGGTLWTPPSGGIRSSPPRQVVVARLLLRVRHAVRGGRDRAADQARDRDQRHDVGQRLQQ